LTIERRDDVKISSGWVSDNKRVSEKIKMFGANGINAIAIVELMFIIKKIVERAGRHGFKIIIFFGCRSQGRERYTRRESGR
jgi:hypothetical protein